MASRGKWWRFLRIAYRIGELQDGSALLIASLLIERSNESDVDVFSREATPFRRDLSGVALAAGAQQPLRRISRRLFSANYP